MNRNYHPSPEWEKYRDDVHHKKMSQVTPVVSTAPPPVFPHLINQGKRIQQERGILDFVTEDI
jgi:hypothetical protein